MIAAVGAVPGRGAREIDAAGAVIAPGFVDVHTHYDGQATWDSRLQPSSWHGVTTVVMGNCGVGFAPVQPPNRDRLVELMEGVEDIPGTALREGLTWNWASFGDYLDVLARRHYDVDVAAQVPHAALRVEVMGARAAAHVQATPDEAAEMARLAGEAVTAGALGFTTSRTLNHKSIDGELTPSYGTAEDELVAIARAVGQTGRGVMQVVSDFFEAENEAEFALLRQAMRAGRLPVSVSLVQNNLAPGSFRDVLAFVTAVPGGGPGHPGSGRAPAGGPAARAAQHAPSLHGKPGLAAPGRAGRRGAGPADALGWPAVRDTRRADQDEEPAASRRHPHSQVRADVRGHRPAGV